MKAASAPAADSAGVSVANLCISHRTTNGRVDLVRDVSLDVRPGDTLALVGESGAGKSLTARSLLGLLPGPTYVSGGSLRVNGIDVRAASKKQLQKLRGGVVGFVPQDPMSALNPVRRIGSVFDEVLARHPRLAKDRPRERIATALAEVGLRETLLDRYPHQLSGGMKQRILIALALVAEPSVVVADEPTTALDATVQAQILDLLSHRIAGRVSLILITHDLGVAASVCKRIAIMYCGRVVETGPTGRLLEKQRHPYTRGLLAAAPDFCTDGSGMVPIPGRPPRPSQIPDGCAFAPRCDHSTEHCGELPQLAGGAHSVACWHPRDDPA